MACGERGIPHGDLTSPMENIIIKQSPEEESRCFYRRRERNEQGRYGDLPSEGIPGGHPGSGESFDWLDGRIYPGHPAVTRRKHG